MAQRILLALVVLVGVDGSPTGTIAPEMGSADMPADSYCIPEMTNETFQIPFQTSEVDPEDAMATGDLNPNHYPAQRAAKVVQHYLNTRHGSPFRRFILQSVENGTAENVNDTGRRYELELTVQETISNTTLNCTAEVIFPDSEEQQPPVVNVSCEDLSKCNATAEEEAFYQQYKTNQSLVSAQNLPDSHGRIDPDKKPFWHLGIVASSFIMLNESNENTLYNMAQVANITQLATEDEQLKFDSHILLHEMVSQEILHWKLLFTWSPAEGAELEDMDRLHRCNH